MQVDVLFFYHISHIKTSRAILLKLQSQNLLQQQSLGSTVLMSPRLFLPLITCINNKKKTFLHEITGFLLRSVCFSFQFFSIIILINRTLIMPYFEQTSNKCFDSVLRSLVVKMPHSNLDTCTLNFSLLYLSRQDLQSELLSLATDRQHGQESPEEFNPRLRKRVKGQKRQRVNIVFKTVHFCRGILTGSTLFCRAAY